MNLTGESKNFNVRIPAKPTPYVLWIFMLCVKFYVANVGKKKKMFSYI